jgi:hypothetical protein
MCPNNWEYALDQAFQITAAWYARERGVAYLSVWETGLGLVSDGSTNEVFLTQSNAVPVPPNVVGMQLGTYY